MPVISNELNLSVLSAEALNEIIAEIAAELERLSSSGRAPKAQRSVQEMSVFAVLKHY